VCLNAAVEDGLVVANPALRVPRLPPAHIERDYLRLDEIPRYLEACAAAYRPLAELLVGSGLRISEALALRVGDLELDKRRGRIVVYKREEDAAMQRGKLDEELMRMSDIADQITPGLILLCNESFASTNEREGSEIARQIIRAVTDAGVRVLFVTHLYDLAHSLYHEQRSDALFLRAERLPDSSHTFRVVVGEPLPTSYGTDSYHRVFGDPESELTPSVDALS